jgi:hypothetical protein
MSTQDLIVARRLSAPLLLGVPTTALLPIEGVGSRAGGCTPSRPPARTTKRDLEGCLIQRSAIELFALIGQSIIDAYMSSIKD